MTMPLEQHLDKIVKSVIIRAPRSRVWKALTSSQEFAQWFRVKTEDQFRTGARVNMETTYPGYEGQKFWADVVEMEPEHRFAWQWHPGGKAAGPVPPEEKPTTVLFVLEEVEGGTRVTVTESGFDQVSLARRAKALESNTHGWEIQMQNIREYVEQAA